jgi:hypothetical protein
MKIKDFIKRLFRRHSYVDLKKINLTYSRGITPLFVLNKSAQLPTKKIILKNDK